MNNKQKRLKLKRKRDMQKNIIRIAKELELKKKQQEIDLKQQEINQTLKAKEDLSQYKKSIDLMITVVKEFDDNILRVYDDTTIGNKDTWSDCGSCSYNKGINKIRVKKYPCPFNSTIESQDINNLDNCHWEGCYFKCMLPMTKEEALDRLNKVNSMF